LGAFDSVTLPVLVCDAYGRLLEASNAGTALLSQAGFLCLRGGRVTAVDSRAAIQLEEAIKRAVRPSSLGPGAFQIALPQRDGQAWLRLDVSSIPRGLHTFGATSVLLVAERSRGGDEAVYEELFGLTVAEAAVAYGLAVGQTPVAIAASRGVSLSTVRTQIRSIYDKLNVKKQTELLMVLKGV
jgi:DNA-binding CsgD family transcriptional regulator